MTYGKEPGPPGPRGPQGDRGPEGFRGETGKTGGQGPAAARAVSLWVGLTGGEANGTELVEGKSIAANDVLDLYFPSGLRLVAADFLSGLSTVDATSLVITVTGEAYAL